MEKKIYTVAIIGVGARGGDIYGKLMMKFPDRFKIVSLCDLRKERLEWIGNEFNVEKENLFLDENEFFKEKRADLCVIASQDKDHIRHCLKAFSLGYDIMMEKPITDSREECKQILDAQKKSGCRVLICHVLRYAPAFLKVGELIKDGVIGRLVAINSTERVGYGHQAHSYVRGNWRKSKETTPMILAKCCHDLDLLQYYANSKCKSISSIGDLTYFTEQNAPESAAMRCLDCKYMDTCVYSAKTGYLDAWINSGSREDGWPFSVVVEPPVTKEKMTSVLKNGPYGRCVYHCDNDVVDHQLTQMTFENGVKATLTMTAFTAKGGRRMTFHGTLGEITLEEADDIIYVERFGREIEKIDIKELCGDTENEYNHGGGDFGLVNSLYDMLEGKLDNRTSLEASIESHLMGICAEQSRLQNGKLIYIHE